MSKDSEGVKTAAGEQEMAEQDEKESAAAAERSAEDPASLMERARRVFSSPADAVNPAEAQLAQEQQSGTGPGGQDEPERSEEESPEAQQARELAAARQEAAENYDKYLRAIAELENYKKRTLKERADLIRYAGEGLARDLVDIIDDLDRAAAQSKAGVAGDLSEGLRLIRERFNGLLERHSIKGEDGVGAMFDPAKFEAIATVPTPGVEPGIVLEQLRRAYFFKDKLLRPGQAVVSAAMPETGTEQGKNSEQGD